MTKLPLLFLIGATFFAATTSTATAQYVPIRWYTNAHNWTIDIGGKSYGVIEQRSTYLPPPQLPVRRTAVYFHGKGLFSTRMRAEYVVALIIVPLMLAASAFLLNRAGRKPATKP